jgi:heme A synthase
MRVVHPFIAVAVGAFLVMLTLRSLRPGSPGSAKRLAKCLLALVLFQFAFGLFNVLLLTPLWMQILHLLTADLIWIMLVLLSAEIQGSRYIAKAENSESTTIGHVAPCGASGR